MVRICRIGLDIRHDDGGSVTRLKACICRARAKGQRRFLEIGISQPRAFGYRDPTR